MNEKTKDEGADITENPVVFSVKCRISNPITYKSDDLKTDLLMERFGKGISTEMFYVAMQRVVEEFERSQQSHAVVSFTLYVDFQKEVIPQPSPSSQYLIDQVVEESFENLKE